MSWTMWHINGHGFLLDGTTEEKYQAFLSNHETAVKDYLRFFKIEELMKRDDWSLDDIRNETDGYTIAEPIAFIMTEETGIPFASCSMTDESEEAIIYEAGYPWQIKEAERNLTEDRLYEILKKYAAELGVENTVGEQDLVYSG